MGSSAGSVVSALRLVGFRRVEETACALDMIVAQRARLIAESDNVHISTSCPLVVSLVLAEYPELVPALAPMPSPMTLHGRLLKEAQGEDSLVVFVGPCLAKKEEAGRSSTSHVDVVLTFRELESWMNEEGLRVSDLPPSDPDRRGSESARLGPIPEGISGLDDCRAVLDRLVRGEYIPAGRFLELLACPGGCVNGPGMPDALEGPEARKSRIASFALGCGGLAGASQEGIMSRRSVRS
jgi:iron only hydrogenase large subunit-like protein